MKPRDYAFAAPRLKAFRVKSLTADQLREILMASPQDIQRILREVYYTKGVEELGDPVSLDMSLRRIYMATAAFLRKSSPPESHPIINSMISRYIGGDVAYIMTTVIMGGQIDSSRIASMIYEPGIARLAEIASEENTLDALVKEIKFLEAYMDPQKPIMLYSSIKEPWSLYWGFHIESALSMARVLESASRGDRGSLEPIMCPRIDYELSASFLQLSLEEQQYVKKLVEILKRLYPGMRGCRVTSALIDSIIDQINTPPAVLSTIQRVPVVGDFFKGKEPLEALLTADVEYRKFMRSRIDYVYSTAPFHPGFVAAVLQLIELDITDLRIAALGVLTGVDKTSIKERVSITI